MATSSGFSQRAVSFEFRCCRFIAVHRFCDMYDIGDKLLHGGFVHPVMTGV